MENGLWVCLLWYHKKYDTHHLWSLLRHALYNYLKKTTWAINRCNRIRCFVVLPLANSVGEGEIFFNIIGHNKLLYKFSQIRENKTISRRCRLRSPRIPTTLEYSPLFQSVKAELWRLCCSANQWLDNACMIHPAAWFVLLHKLCTINFYLYIQRDGLFLWEKNCYINYTIGQAIIYELKNRSKSCHHSHDKWNNWLRYFNSKVVEFSECTP